VSGLGAVPDTTTQLRARSSEAAEKKKENSSTNCKLLRIVGF